jgi:cytochrome b6-f complex iron-sulfur subunit
VTRRKIIWLIAAGFAWLAAGVASLVTVSGIVLFFVRRRLPHAIEEPSSIFRLGPASDFALGISTRFVQSYRVYVARNKDRLYVLYARCTHRGCTPDWVATENSFKCPCHESKFCMGSTFDREGINCQGPAPRPLDRVHVTVDVDGNVIADLSKVYQWTNGHPSQFDEPGAYISLKKT